MVPGDQLTMDMTNKAETMSVPEAGKKYFGLSRNGATTQPNAAKFRPFALDVCFGCRCAQWSDCSTGSSEPGRMPLEFAEAQSGARCDSHRHVAGAVAGWPPLGHHEPHAGQRRRCLFHGDRRAPSTRAAQPIRRPPVRQNCFVIPNTGSPDQLPQDERGEQ